MKELSSLPSLVTPYTVAPAGPRSVAPGPVAPPKVDVSGPADGVNIDFTAKAPTTAALVAEPVIAPVPVSETVPGGARVVDFRPGALFSLGQGTLAGEAVFRDQATGALLQMDAAAGAPAFTQADKLKQYGLASTAMPSLSGIQEMVTRYFTASEFQVLNSGKYHNADHPVAVAEAATALAKGMGYAPERVHFLGQVALLHDADERIQANTGEVKTGTPARAQVTLEWMDKNQSGLQERMGWSDTEFVEAKALIARTEFPFDDKPKNPMGTKYDGQSPAQVYKGLLGQLPESRRAQVMQEGVVLRFADQGGFYAGSFDMALDSVKGLAQELQGVGVPTTLGGTIKFTPTFLSDVGKDTKFDQQIAQDLGVKADIPGRERLVETWPAGMQKNFKDNAKLFGDLGKLIDQIPPEQLEAKLGDCVEAVKVSHKLFGG